MRQPLGSGYRLQPHKSGLSPWPAMSMDCHCYGCRWYYSERQRYESLPKGKIQPASATTASSFAADVPPFGTQHVWIFLSGESRARVASASSVLKGYWTIHKLPCVVSPRSAEAWLRYGREAAENQPVTEKEQQVVWLINIFRDAVPRESRPDVAEFVSVLRMARLTQIGHWRMEEDAPQLREEEGPQQRYLRAVRGVFDDVQANRCFRPECEVGILCEALQLSCKLSTPPAWRHHSQRKQFARALRVVVDDVSKQALFCREGAMGQLLRFLQYECRALFGDETYDSDYDSDVDDSDDDDDDLSVEYAKFAEARFSAMCARVSVNCDSGEPRLVMLPATDDYLTDIYR